MKAISLTLIPPVWALSHEPKFRMKLGRKIICGHNSQTCLLPKGKP